MAKVSTYLNFWCTRRMEHRRLEHSKKSSYEQHQNNNTGCYLDSKYNTSLQQSFSWFLIGQNGWIDQEIKSLTRCLYQSDSNKLNVSMHDVVEILKLTKRPPAIMAVMATAAFTAATPRASAMAWKPTWNKADCIFNNSDKSGGNDHDRYQKEVKSEINSWHTLHRKEQPLVHHAYNGWTRQFRVVL